MKKNFLKRAAAISCAAAALSAMALAGCTTTTTTEVKTPHSSSSAAHISKNSAEPGATGTADKNVIYEVDASNPYASGIHHVVMNVEGYDPITIELNADEAPVSVVNFMKLAKDGYYNGLTFYRFQKDFCMQGGTVGNSASGDDPNISRIVGEFSGNDVNNSLADNFKRGTVAMARTTDPNSATSTFFVTLSGAAQVAASLNGQYAAFGQIDSAGMDIVDQIVKDHLEAASANGMGMVSDEEDQAVISSIEIID